MSNGFDNDEYMELLKEISKANIAEIEKRERKRYWKEKWVSILALVISIAAFIKSFFF